MTSQFKFKGSFCSWKNPSLYSVSGDWSPLRLPWKPCDPSTSSITPTPTHEVINSDWFLKKEHAHKSVLYLFNSLLDGKSSPRQLQEKTATSNYTEDNKDDDDMNSPCACQRWLFTTLLMPIFAVLSVIGFVLVVLLMPCKYCCNSFTNLLIDIEQFGWGWTVFLVMWSSRHDVYQELPRWIDVLIDPHISMHILQTVLYSFPITLRRWFLLQIKDLFNWWSCPLFSWP